VKLDNCPNGQDINDHHYAKDPNEKIGLERKGGPGPIPRVQQVEPTKTKDET
jgi:hypothetical protein